MHQYNVDLFINGHVHKYERTKPVFKETSYWEKGDKSIVIDAYKSINDSDIFKNARGAIYVTEGNAGKEGEPDKDYPLLDYGAMFSNKTGYGILNILSGNQLVYERKETETGKIMDSFIL